MDEMNDTSTRLAKYIAKYNYSREEVLIVIQWLDILAGLAESVIKQAGELEDIQNSGGKPNMAEFADTTADNVVRSAVKLMEVMKNGTGR